MKTLALLLAFFPLLGNAAVTARFAGPTGMITVLDYAPVGLRDQDPHRLYDLMEVPLKQEPGYGLGKTVRTADRQLLITCGIGMHTHKACSVVVKPGPWSHIQPELGLIQYVTYGEEAAALSKVFFRQPEGSYSSADGRLLIQAWNGFFLLLFANAPPAEGN